MEFVAIVVPLFLLTIGAGVVWISRNSRLLRRREKRRRAPLPSLIIPTSAGAADIIPAGVIRETVPAAEQRAELATTEPGNAEFDQQLETWDEPSRGRPMPREQDGNATLTLRESSAETLQALPAHLEVLSGESAGRELHLVGTAGERTRILVGRQPGRAPRHITLRSPSVSRRHAQIEFVDGQWTITNLSATNPVLVNSRALVNGTGTQPLSDGDRIELGEVALRFMAS
ncbi:MAG: FHA domain-containing protein [Gemmatimonadaceae bacterium]